MLCAVVTRVACSEPPGITRCQSGAGDILGAKKAYAVQICNLFGATCYVNSPTVNASDCGTHALEVASGQCKLFPLLASKNNELGGDELLSTEGNLGCSVSSSCSNGDCTYKYSPGCVSVQCSLGDEKFAGPGFSGTSGSKRTAVTDTAKATFTADTLASLPSEAKQLKNVFLVRTGDYVATSGSSKSSSNSISYSIGKLPTSNGNNYGPVACPGTGNLLTSEKAKGISAEDLRMCGSTGKWTYYNGLNFLLDKDLFVSYSNDEGKDEKLNIALAPYLTGKSAYRSAKAMDDTRKVFMHDGTSNSAEVLMESDEITPKPGPKTTFKDEEGGTWRSFGVAFYCDDYARTDLTTCAEANRKLFYVCDPNPNACYGSAKAISSNAGMLGETCSADEDCCSGSCADDKCAAGCEAGGAGGDGAAAGAAEKGVAVAAFATMASWLAGF